MATLKEVDELVQAEKEADRELLAIFGESSTLNNMFRLDDQWRMLSGFQRLHIVEKVRPGIDGFMRAVLPSTPLCELHTCRHPFRVEEVREVVRILREENLDEYR